MLDVDQGDAKAQYHLGKMHYNDKEMEQNYKKAFEYFMLAADQGYAKAQCRVGKMYEDGHDLAVKKDASEALRFYRLASNQGHSYAQYLLQALLHTSIQDASMDDHAIEFFESSARLGIKDAERRLKARFRKGH